MKIAFRVDASTQIGTGHFMRCLTIANALKKRGAQIRFVSRFLPEHLVDMLSSEGHEFMHLSSRKIDSSHGDLAHAHWLGTSQHTDANDSIHALSGQEWDWLVVDHYALDERWEKALRKMTRHILIIDDIADRKHDCDVLLDQNYYSGMETRYSGKVPEHCQLLLGPRYALLRDEFRQLREQASPRSGPIKRVLVFFGGVDVDNCTGKTIEALANLGVQNIHVDVVIGALHPNREQLELECAGHRFECHVQTSRMAALMAAADFAIGAGGSATWERCCLGLASLTVSTADNQIAIARELEKLGAGKYYDLTRSVDIKDYFRIISSTMMDFKSANRMSKRAFEIVDGLGVDRFCASIGC